MRCLIFGSLFVAQLAAAEELIEGYLVNDPINPLCPISAEALPNIRKTDLDSLPAERRKTIVDLTGFYQFLHTNLSGYCLIQLRLADNSTQEVFVPKSVYDKLFSGVLPATKLREQNQSHFITLKGEELEDGNYKAIRGYDIKFRLVDHRPEIIR